MDNLSMVVLLLKCFVKSNELLILRHKEVIMFGMFTDAVKKQIDAENQKEVDGIERVKK